MLRIFQYLKKYLPTVGIIIVLLLVQAFCDLSLPQYTSDIIDTGIQNKGVEHVLPEKIRTEEYQYVQLFMKSSEQKDFQKAYKKDGKYYVRKDLKKDTLEKLDDQLAVAFIANAQLSSVEKSSFFEQLEQQQKLPKGSLQEEQVKGMFAKLGIPYQVTTKTVKKSGKKVKVEYIDERPVFAAMINSGTMDQKILLTMRSKMEKKFDTLGESMVRSTAITSTIAEEKKTGIDIDARQTGYLWIAGAKMLCMAFLMAASAILAGFFSARVGAGIGKELRGKMYEKVMSFSDAEMNRFSTASLITRSTNDIQQIQMVETMVLRMILYAPIIGIGGIIKVLSTRSGMEWIIVVAVITLVAVVMVLMGVAMPRFKKMQILVDRINLVAREILTGLPVIRAFGREKKEEERFDDANVALTKNMLFTNRVMTFMMPLMMFIMYGVSILIVWVSTDKINTGTIQVGTMTAFITYSMQIVMAFLMITMFSVMLPRASVSAERIDEVLNTKVSIEDKPDTKANSVANGEVAFEHVSFAYPGAKENVLEDISFVAKTGQTTAIIGGTGSGKTTLVNLIPRFFDVTKGKVMVDGTDIREMSQESLREAIGYVPQKGVLFSGTIASNLRYGKEDATKEQVMDAARIAQAKEIIDGKKDGLDSAIAQGGSNVSGGQKQRFSIARAIVKDPKIYIFDDSFSALDYKTDAILRRELSKKTKEAAVIIVAQRISTILHAEQIIVLNEGKVAGIGTHQELFDHCAVYREIAESQLSEADIAKLKAQRKEVM